jgi:hypothetical protein
MEEANPRLKELAGRANAALAHWSADDPHRHH